MEEIKKEDNIKNIEKKLDGAMHSRSFKIVLLTIAGLIILALVFGAGTMIGYKRANFSYRWGENYHQMFGGPRGGFMGSAPMMGPGFLGDDLINAHGTAGTVVKIDGRNLIIAGSDNVEKTILISDKTIIRLGRQDIKVSDLKTGDLTVIIGQPNDQGQIEASLIRVFNAPVATLQPASPTQSK